MMKWLSAGDIKNWANTKSRHCSETLPELIRRLIFATANPIEQIDFPCGDSVTSGGWDGRLKTAVVSPFFPSGSSAWEIGTEASPGKKAGEDYDKRTADPLGLIPAETSFVFVTPRVWSGRGKWQNDKLATKVWKGVRVIAADGLEQWLSLAPAVALWLAKQIGKVNSDHIRDIESLWEEWSLSTDPAMTTDLVIGGRTRDIERVHQWLGQRAGIFEVQGDSPDEAFAFLYAAIMELPELERVQALSRCVVVEDINELRACTNAFQNPLIIAAPGQCIEAAGAATAKGHHVFLSMDARVIDMGSILKLSRPQYSAVEKVLQKNGFTESRSQQLARDFGRSIPVLRRHLFRSKLVSAPTWANSAAAQFLLPALLAGSWTDQKSGDRQIIELLSGKNYDDFTKGLDELLLADDSPIRKVGNVWMVKSPLDLWFLIARHFDTKLLNLYQQAVQTTLKHTDPKYDLPEDKRWAAAVYGKSDTYSEWLRNGLAESLVLLAVYGDKSEHISSPQAQVDKIVKEVFSAAQTWEAWASLKDVTPLLAEAAPDIFLEAIEQAAAKNPNLLIELMKDGGGAIFGECRHCGLLWGLEATAWSGEYFARTVNIFFNLIKIDPGGKWNNRAVNSLRSIFLPGYPQTYAEPKDRIEVFNQLIAKDAKVVWQFAGHYFNGGSFSESHRFRWRSAGGDRRGLEPESNENHREYINGLLPLLNDLACRKENLVSSTDEFIRVPDNIRKLLTDALEKVDVNVFSKEERAQLLQNVREALNWINSYGKDDAIKMHIPALNKALKKFAPEDVLERVGWLLSNPWPRLPEGEPETYDSKDTAITAARESAAREVLDKVSLEKILEFANTVQYIGVLGHALGKVIRDDKEDILVIDALLKHVTDNPGLIKGYALGRVEASGPDWVSKQVDRLKTKDNFSTEACALLFFGLPEAMPTWLEVGKQGIAVEDAYWKHASGYLRSENNEDIAFAVERLIRVKRPAVALTVAGSPKVSISSKLLQQLIVELLAASKDKKLNAGAMEEFHLGHVFNQIYERNELPIEEIAKLEWPFAGMFDELKRYVHKPLAMHQTLQKDPSFFAQLISFIYKRDDHKPDPGQAEMDKESLGRIASNAHDVLSSWRFMPGRKEDGSLDEKELVSWVESARQQCAATNHVIGGDLQIAEMLSRAPSDPDGTWPHVGVRNLIERLNNQTIDDHIPIGIYNSRGVVSRGLTDGGRQERELAKKYKEMVNAVKSGWPRTAKILRTISQSYEADAKREDLSSDLNDLRWN